MKQINKKGYRNSIGAMGEEIVRKHFLDHGWEILEQNYLKEWGEIDIVARENNIVRFIEVKTVSFESKHELEQAVSHGTWRPEENFHQKKFLRLSRVIESWIMENEFDGEWEIDVVAVRIVPCEKYARIKYIRNIIM